MTEITAFFNALTEEHTWVRVLWVILGSILVYLALMWDGNRWDTLLSR